MKILYFDCFAGISGDMTVGALLEVGVSEKYLVEQLCKLHLEGFHIETKNVIKNGITARYFEVVLEEYEGFSYTNTFEYEKHSHELGGHQECGHHSHEHRSYKDIVHIIEHSHITDGAKVLALNIFKTIAVAEAKIHGTTIEKVSFHEVGAVDSIIDIVGTAICIDYLKPDKIYSSVVNDGHGFVKCQHGKIPVPVPAVCEIFSAKENVICKQINIEKELVTPTGAAIIGELSERFCFLPQMNIIKIGYGAGTQDLEIPNVLRVVMGEVNESDTDDFITVIEANIDDSTPEVLGYVMEKLFLDGAKDVFFTNIQMKKNRPAIKLTVLCHSDCIHKMEKIIFSETSTIGIRKRIEQRTCLPRIEKTVSTPYGLLKVKEVYYEGIKKTYPEYECAKKMATENNVPLRTIIGLI